MPVGFRSSVLEPLSLCLPVSDNWRSKRPVRTGGEPEPTFRKGRKVTEQSRRTESNGSKTAEENGSLTVTDNRTDESYDIDITDGTARAMDFREIKVSEDDFGLMTYDPGFSNTASCRSAITYIDGEEGILQHRGIPIEQLCEHSSYLEVAYLLIYGELPTESQLN